jgi:hypothetical protein
MNFGPLEFGAWLRRLEAREEDSGAVCTPDAVPRPVTETHGIAVISGPAEPVPLRAARGDAVSVYEAILDRAEDRADPVRVRVQPAWRPVVLVLSSHLPVCWQIEAAAGADLRGIVLAGSGESRVTGASAVPVGSLGGIFAFKRGSAEFQLLEREVLRCTGCSIEHFHGTYAEDHFDVGLD